MRRRRPLTHPLGRALVPAVAALAAVTLTAAAAVPTAGDGRGGPGADGPVLEPGTTLYVDPDSTTAQAAAGLTGQAQADALALAEIPTAVWFTGGSPSEVRREVRDLVRDADKAGDVPVLVAYNLPFRDCSQYSAGGAGSAEEYRRWVRALAQGIGNRDAVVVLEPDGLGIIPWYTTVEGVQEWCQPAEADPATAADERFAMLRYAVDVLGQNARTAVYLDGTHSGWLNVGDITDRLLKAGVQDADGFYLNASNYQYTANLVHYGTWISSCIAYVTEVTPGDYAGCGNQYWSGGPANDWTGVALSQLGEWSDTAPEPELNTAGVTSRYAAALGDVEPTTHFVVDTSRNGQGPWDASGETYSDPETWCNPPERGLGLRPTTDTGNELVDAYLWIKVPGESDGRCLRGTAGPEDPERGMVDPAAGQWFPEQARELIELAVPPL
ncbi:glycoside hydrolase family 6 protein [Actinotalea sp. AC32]|nr:glycoside hydrolase family 6 protein [Actinotalea sp. AC32]